MRAAPGVGLAAPQLGEALNVCVVEVDDRVHELVNPKIVKSAGDDRDLEGCLSIPGYAAYVTRRERVWIVAQDRRGRRIKVAGSGLLGRAFQHELDHLDGKLYIDYLDSMDELIAVTDRRPGDEDEEESEGAGEKADKKAGVRAPALA
jgi:peptide deformylase